MTPSATTDRLWLWLGATFSLLFGALALFRHPNFPVFTPYGIHLPYWLPLCGLLPVFFLIHVNRKTMAALWLLLAVPPILLFNANLLRPDVYCLLLCLWVGILSNDKEQWYFGLRMVLAGMYIWTGIHKINPDFMELTPAFLQKRLFHGSLPDSVLGAGVMAFPLAEITVGLLCLLPFAKIRSVAGIALHIGILAMLLLGGWNGSMVPWNLFLIACHLFLWKDDSRYTLRNIRPAAAPAILSLLMPALFFVGVWPVFASWTMYSARVESHYVDIPETLALNPPANIRNYIYSFDGKYYVGLTQWADAETGGAPCSEPWLKPMLFRETKAFLMLNDEF